MKFEILTSSYFDAEAKRLAKRYRSFVADLLAFQKSILENPYQGVELTTGIRKIRMPIASKGRGRAGGARVITLTYTISEVDGVIILLLIYDKADASSVKLEVVKHIVKDLGFDINALHNEGRLRPQETSSTNNQEEQTEKPSTPK